MTSNNTPAEPVSAPYTLEAVREEAAKIAERHGKVVSNEPIGKACSSNIAAAIRAMPLPDGWKLREEGQ